METVIRTLAADTRHRDSLRVFCCEGAQDHGDLPVVTLPKKRKPRLKALFSALEAFQPDLIEFHQQISQAVHGSRWFPSTARILYRHNALKTSANPIDRWRYENRYRRMDGLVFVSESEREIFNAAFPRLCTQSHAVPNPIRAEEWVACPRARDPIIAFAGRAMAEKGVDLICAALPSVLDRHPDWRAVLMLNDWDIHGTWAQPHVAPLERYGDRVTVMRSAPLAEVRRVMQRASIALTPSIWAEPLGLTALEAHAAGAALISSGRGGLREASGPHALYVDELTPATLAQAMETLITDPDRRTTMALAAQAYVLDIHRPERRAAELDHLRQRLVERKRQKERPI